MSPGAVIVIKNSLNSSVNFRFMEVVELKSLKETPSVYNPSNLNKEAFSSVQNSVKHINPKRKTFKIKIKRDYCGD
jgi:hypothetical protein